MAYIITRDGRPTFGRYATEYDVLGEMHKRSSQSLDWAMAHEGYNVISVPDDRWSDLEARELRARALRLFADHDHDGHWDRMTRENCGACALAGYGASADEGPLAPNYAGWARDYVQAGRPIPARWYDAFQAERTDESNTPYRDALALDVATFGVRFLPGVAHVRTHADGFGVWHAEVMIIGTGNDRLARDRARKAIMAELVARAPRDVRPAFRVRLSHRDSRDDTLTYYFDEVTS